MCLAYVHILIAFLYDVSAINTRTVLTLTDVFRSEQFIKCVLECDSVNKMNVC